MLTINKVLVATDFGEVSEAALTYGRELAGRFGATLDVLHVAENIYVKALGAESYAAVAPANQERLEREARQALDALLDNDRSGPKTTGVVMTFSTPAFAIIDYAKDNNIDLIVMGTHGRGALGHLVMGSVAERVVRDAPCPVLTVRLTKPEVVRSDVPIGIAQTSHA